jgi:peptidoglycan/xylan/chitin deacetylase (PgdA/CDA1 family)
MSIDLLDEMLEFTEAILREPAPRALHPARPRSTRSEPKRLEGAAATTPQPRPTVLVGCLVLVLLWVYPVAPSLRVHVNGRSVVLHTSSPSVGTVLRRAGAVPNDGALVAVVSGRTLDEHFDRARIVRGAQRISLASAVRSGDQIAVSNGHAVVEPVAHRTASVPGGGLPEIEYGLWNAPRAGATDQIIGVRSGEVVSEQPTAAPVSATPVGDLVVGLTFDDGPNPASTPAILAILKAAGIKATFCVVGYAAKLHPQLVRAIHDDGHTLCNHTMHHTQLLGSKSPDMITAEIRDDNDLIEGATGVKPTFFRAPGGTWASNLVAEVHRQGMRALGWNVDPADYKRPGASVITGRVLQQLRPGALILLHDGGGDRSQTVAQLSGLIEHLRALGYSFRVPSIT